MDIKPNRDNNMLAEYTSYRKMSIYCSLCMIFPTSSFQRVPIIPWYLVLHHLAPIFLQVKGPCNPPRDPFRTYNPYKWTGWWLNQPIWKICKSNWIISPSRGENKKYLKPPPSGVMGPYLELVGGAPVAGDSKSWPNFYPQNLRKFQQTPGTYPRPSTTCLWRKSISYLYLGYLEDHPS